MFCSAFVNEAVSIIKFFNAANLLLADWVLFSMCLTNPLRKVTKNIHTAWSVQIRSFLWSVFSRIQTEYGEIRSISPYSVRMRKNAGKMRTRITLNTDSFYVVNSMIKLLKYFVLYWQGWWNKGTTRLTRYTLLNMRAIF